MIICRLEPLGKWRKGFAPRSGAKVRRTERAGASEPIADCQSAGRWRSPDVQARPQSCRMPSCDTADWQSALRTPQRRETHTPPLSGVWTFFTCSGLVRASVGVTRAKRPGPYQPGQRPRSRAPKTTPSANGAAQFSKSLSAGCSFHIVSANHSVEFARRMPAVAAKAGDRIPRVLCLGSKWNALSAL